MTHALLSVVPDVSISLAFDAGADALLDRLSGPMTRSQSLTLRSLAIEAYQPRQFEPGLTRAEAARRIQALRDEIALADSF